jgi:hypothetical protein
MTNKKPTPKGLWKATQLEYLHNCFIGISHLTCSQENCPLVLNWGEIEKKQSKRGKCALYQIVEEQWVVVDLTKYEENDLGTYDNLEIQFKSGKTQRTKPKHYEEPEPTTPELPSWMKKTYHIAPSQPVEPKPKEIFLKEEEVVLFFNISLFICTTQ